MQVKCRIECLVLLVGMLGYLHAIEILDAMQKVKGRVQDFKREKNDGLPLSTEKPLWLYLDLDFMGEQSYKSGIFYFS